MGEGEGGLAGTKNPGDAIRCDLGDICSLDFRGDLRIRAS